MCQIYILHAFHAIQTHQGSINCTFARSFQEGSKSLIFKSSAQASCSWGSEAKALLTAIGERLKEHYVEPRSWCCFFVFWVSQNVLNCLCSFLLYEELWYEDRTLLNHSCYLFRNFVFDILSFSVFVSSAAIHELDFLNKLKNISVKSCQANWVQLWDCWIWSGAQSAKSDPKWWWSVLHDQETERKQVHSAAQNFSRSFEVVRWKNNSVDRWLHLPPLPWELWICSVRYRALTITSLTLFDSIPQRHQTRARKKSRHLFSESGPKDRRGRAHHFSSLRIKSVLRLYAPQHRGWLRSTRDALKRS